MLIKESIRISKFNNKGFWVLNTAEGRNLLINESTAELIQILESANNLTEANKLFNSYFKVNVSHEQFESVILEKIGGYNILNDDKYSPKESQKNQYLKLKVQLLSPYVAGLLSKPFHLFFSPTLFWWMLICLSASLLSVLVSSPVSGESINYITFVILVGFTTLVHELGHIGACARFGLKHGGIGFGFYFIMPVMYADITNIWNTDREKRVVANLAGIFNEILYANILVLIFLYTDNQTFLLSAVFIATLLLWQLNPFVRFDGYWVLSDLTDTPNLLKKSADELKHFFSLGNLVRMKSNLSRRKVLLLIYGILNFLVGIGFMIFTISHYRNEIVNYPGLAYEFISKLATLTVSFQNINLRFLVVTLFYFLALRFLYKKLKSLLAKRSLSNFRLKYLTSSIE